MGSTHALYPEAKVWGVTGLTDKRPDLKLDAVLTQPGSFEGVLDYLQFQGFGVILPGGIKLAHETVFCHQPSGSLILTDIAFNFDQNSPLTTRLAVQILGSYKALRPSRLERWGSRDKGAIAAAVQQILAWNFDRVIPGHGAIVDTGGKAQFKAGYEWFLGRGNLSAQV